MALISTISSLTIRHPFLPVFTCSQSSLSLSVAASFTSSSSSSSLLSSQISKFRQQAQNSSHTTASSYRFSSSGGTQAEEEEEEEASFQEAVALFNSREYYRCHDLLEALWHKSDEPTRTLIHAILQCAVGFHHLFNSNHKGAMMELGEGLYKLRKIDFESGPFHEFEKEISAVLDFIYRTQLELAACTDDFCIALDQSERSYQLLGGYAAGQHLYYLESDPSEMMYIVYHPKRSDGNSEKLRVKLPILRASEENPTTFE